jgi:hypothetical protein
MIKANPLQQQFLEQLKQSLREDLVLHQRLVKQIKSVSRHTSSVLEDSYLQSLILRRTLYWQIALELCIATLDMPIKSNPQWQSVHKKIQSVAHQQATALKLKVAPIGAVEPCAIVEDYLKMHNGKNLSIKTIRKDLKISRAKIIQLISRSKHIVPVKPLDVGSRAYFLHVYSYKA